MSNPKNLVMIYRQAAEKLIAVDYFWPKTVWSPCLLDLTF